MNKKLVNIKDLAKYKKPPSDDEGLEGWLNESEVKRSTD